MVSFFDLVAPLYGKPRRRTYKTLQKIERAVQFNGADVVVDVGGGGGALASLIKKSAAHTVVVDPSRKMIAQCRKQGVLGLVGSAEDIPLSDESVDKVLLVDSFHHVGGQVRAVQEARRILKPGGQAVLVEFNPNTWGGAAISFMEWVLNMDSTFHAPMELATFFAAGGFKTRIEHSHKIQYLLVATK